MKRSLVLLDSHNTEITDKADFFRFILDSTPGLISYLDFELRYHFVNHSFEKWFQVAEVIGKTVSEILGGDAEHEITCHLDATRRGESVQFERRLDDVAGQTRFVEGRLIPHKRPDGTVAGFVVVLRDITESKMFEFELRMANEQLESYVAERTQELRESLRAQEATAKSFQSLIEHSPGSILVHKNGLIVYVNPAFVAMLGYQHEDEVLGHDVADLIPEKLRSSVRQQHGRLRLPGDRLEIGESMMLHRDGSEVPIDVSALCMEHDGQIAVLTVARESAVRKTLSADMMKIERMVTMGRLAAGVGHEINNPLAYMSGNLDFIDDEIRSLREGVARGMPKEEINAALDAIEELRADAKIGTDRVAAVALDLRTLTKAPIQSVGKVDLKAVINSAIKMSHNEVRHRAILKLDDSDVPIVVGSESRLGQVFLNLLINAAQAIVPGNVDKNEIVVSFKTQNSMVAVEVRDSGAGIPPEDLERVFEPFFTSKAGQEGTGLGLAICKDLVEQSGGSILVESHLGEGTTFFVLLPIFASKAQV